MNMVNRILKWTRKPLYGFMVTTLLVSSILFLGFVQTPGQVMAEATTPEPTKPPEVSVVQAAPNLSIPTGIAGTANQTVQIPISFTGGGNAISSLVFGLLYNTTHLSFNPVDSNIDGIPDNIVFNLPAGFAKSVTYDAASFTSKITIVVLDPQPPLTALVDGVFATITMTVGNVAGSDVSSSIMFSSNPAASFGNTVGQGVAGTTTNGSVLINSSLVAPTLTVLSPTNVATGSAAFTLTVTGTGFINGSSVVRWNGTALTTTFVSATSLTAAVPAANVAAAGTAAITVANTLPGGGVSNALTFTIGGIAPGTNLVINPGFENWDGWDVTPTVYTAGYSTIFAHTGTRSLRTGIYFPPDNRFSYSSARQFVVIPPNATTASLQFFAYQLTFEPPAKSVTQGAPIGKNIDELEKAEQSADKEESKVLYGGDVQYCLILDAADNILESLLWRRENLAAWTSYTYDLMRFRGLPIKIHFGTYNDGWNGVTSMFVDDVSVTYNTTGGGTGGPNTISGYVRSNGAPQAGITVQAGGYSAVTDANGLYTLSSLPIGTYTVSPVAGYYWNNYYFTPSTRSVTVPPNQPNMDFEMHWWWSPYSNP